MNKGKAILLLLRLPFMTVTIGAVLLGTAFAWWSTRQFDLLHFLLALFGACFLHIACNVANDYFDYRSGGDALNKNAVPPFSGGSRMVLDGFVKPREALIVSLVFTFLGSCIGFYLTWVTPGPVILIIGAAALLFVYGYNGFPLKLVNKGLGEIAIFLAWGPLMVFGAYYVQSETLTFLWPLVASIPSGILTTLVLLINEFADKDADQESGRRTWVTLFGYRAGMFIYLFLALCCYLVVVFGVLFGGWPVWSFLVFLTFPLAVMSFLGGMKTLEDWPKFLGAVKSTILMNFVFLVLLSIAFFI